MPAPSGSTGTSGSTRTKPSNPRSTTWPRFPSGSRVMPSADQPERSTRSGCSTLSCTRCWRRSRSPSAGCSCPPLGELPGWQRASRRRCRDRSTTAPTSATTASPQWAAADCCSSPPGARRGDGAREARCWRARCWESHSSSSRRSAGSPWQSSWRC